MSSQRWTRPLHSRWPTRGYVPYYVWRRLSPTTALTNKHAIQMQRVSLAYGTQRAAARQVVVESALEDLFPVLGPARPAPAANAAANEERGGGDWLPGLE